jgi:hypothetical protein
LIAASATTPSTAQAAIVPTAIAGSLMNAFKDETPFAQPPPALPQNRWT